MVKVSLTKEGPLVSPTYSYRHQTGRKAEILVELLLWFTVCATALFAVVHSPLQFGAQHVTLLTGQKQTLRRENGVMDHKLVEIAEADKKSIYVLRTETNLGVPNGTIRKDEGTKGKETTVHAEAQDVQARKQKMLSP